MVREYNLRWIQDGVYSLRCKLIVYWSFIYIYTELSFEQISGKTPERKDLFPTSSSRTIDPCISILDDIFAVAKDEYLIAVNPKTIFQDFHVPVSAGSVSKDDLKVKQEAEHKKMFKSLAWTHPLQTLSKYFHCQKMM